MEVASIEDSHFKRLEKVSKLQKIVKHNKLNFGFSGVWIRYPVA